MDSPPSKSDSESPPYGISKDSSPFHIDTPPDSPAFHIDTPPANPAVDVPPNSESTIPIQKTEDKGEVAGENNVAKEPIEIKISVDNVEDKKQNKILEEKVDNLQKMIENKQESVIINEDNQEKENDDQGSDTNKKGLLFLNEEKNKDEEEKKSDPNTKTIILDN